MHNRHLCLSSFFAVALVLGCHDEKKRIVPAPPTPVSGAARDNIISAVQMEAPPGSPKDAQPTVPLVFQLVCYQIAVPVGTVSRIALPLDPQAIAWFLRGMSVAESYRSRGIGGEILAALIAYAAGCDPGGIVWCHARLPAESFYIRHGFKFLDRIELPEKGPRLRMARPLVL